MSDVYPPSFFFPPDTKEGALTYPQLEARRRIAAALATRNRPYPKTIGEGLTALGEGIGEGMLAGQISREEAQMAARGAASKQRHTLPGVGPQSGAPAPVVPRTAPRPTSEMVAQADPRAETSTRIDDIESIDQAAIERARASATPEGARKSLIMSSATADETPLTPGQAEQQPKMSIEEVLQRLARNETGGVRGDPYQAIGERSKRGDYPYGKYQVMGENIPKWSKQYLGRSLTPQEFLADPKAQEQIARGKASEYVAKYGPVGAAGAWFAGEQGMKDYTRKDALGTSVIEYRRRFSAPLVSRDQVTASATGGEDGAPYQVASLGDGVVTREMAQTSPRDSIAQVLAGPLPQSPTPPGAAPVPGPNQMLAQAPVQQQPPRPQIRRNIVPGAQVPQPPGTSTPSTEGVPAYDIPEYPDPGPWPVLPRETPRSKQQMDALADANDASLPPDAREHARTVYDAWEKDRTERRAAEIADYNEKLKVRTAAEEKRLTYNLGLPKLRTEQQEARQKLEKDQREQQVAEAFKGMDPKQVETTVQKSREAADAQAAGYRSIMEARRAFTESGVIPVTGAFADQRLAAMKAATLAGVADYSKEIQATEVFRSSMAPVVAAALKATVGTTQISNADREFAEKAAAGAITLDEGSIKRMLDIGQRAQLIALNRHQDLLGGTYGRINPQLGETLFGVDLGLPQDKVQLLMENRHKKADFDEKYGPGAADYTIRRHDWKTTGK